MTIKRYARSPVLNFGYQYGTSNACRIISDGVKNGSIRYEKTFLKAGERLDILAGKIYGDGKLWWILAGASKIGWSCQTPPGTEIIIPNLEDVGRLLS
jgi:hypothetical protein